MPEVKITCATVATNNPTLQGIVEVGGFNWTRPRSDVVQLIDNRINSFFTQDAFGHRANVITVHPGGGAAPYLRTTADERKGNNLLHLESCRWR